MKMQQTKLHTERLRHAIRRGLCVAPALLTSFGALAQEADVGGGETIDVVIVSSTRREMGVQDVPISITAVGGKEAESLGLENLMSWRQWFPA